MNAEELVRAGRLNEALESLQDDIRKNPANADLRVFLFQLLCLLGQWQRALTQLNTAAEMEPSTMILAQMYRPVIQCEALRSEVFAGTRSPLIFGEPPEWMGTLVEALHLTANGEHASAQELREQAFEMAPATNGSVNGEPFAWLADADSRQGPTIEAVINGRYFWVPMQNIHQITIEEPGDLRDFVWLPAQFTWANGGEMVGLIPTRYPGSEGSGDDLIRLARKTDWKEVSEGAYLGQGQRMLATDTGDYPILDVRQIELAPLDDASPTEHEVE